MSDFVSQIVSSAPNELFWILASLVIGAILTLTGKFILSPVKFIIIRVFGYPTFLVHLHYEAIFESEPQINFRAFKNYLEEKLGDDIKDFNYGYLSCSFFLKNLGTIEISSDVLEEHNGVTAKTKDGCMLHFTDFNRVSGFIYVTSLLKDFMLKTGVSGFSDGSYLCNLESNSSFTNFNQSDLDKKYYRIVKNRKTISIWCINPDALKSLMEKFVDF